MSWAISKNYDILLAKRKEFAWKKKTSATVVHTFFKIFCLFSPRQKSVPFLISPHKKNIGDKRRHHSFFSFRKIHKQQFTNSVFVQIIFFSIKLMLQYLCEIRFFLLLLQWFDAIVCYLVYSPVHFWLGLAKIHCYLKHIQMFLFWPFSLSSFAAAATAPAVCCAERNGCKAFVIILLLLCT